MKNKLFLFASLIIFIIFALGLYFLNSGLDNNAPASNNTLSKEVKELYVDNYIKENISTLSPEDAVLGGTFMVTSVTFLNGDNAVVEYEDGHIVLSAKANYEVSDNGDVEIKSFKIIEDENNFSKIGNIVERAGDWVFVYEEPGKPALTISLVFDDLSMCSDEREDGSCLPAYWDSGNRVEINGNKGDDVLIVRSFRVVGESSKSIDSGDIGEKICEDLCGNGFCEEIVCMGEGCPCAETSVSCPTDCE